MVCSTLPNSLYSTVVQVGFEFTNYTVVESVGAVNVCVVLTGEIERNVTVTVEIRFTDGDPGQLRKKRNVQDLVNFVIDTLTFADGVDEPRILCTSVPIFDDEVVAIRPQNILILTSEDRSVILNPSTTIITVLDDDSELNFFTS